MTPEHELQQLRERVRVLESERPNTERAEIIRGAVDAHVGEAPIPPPEYHEEKVVKSIPEQQKVEVPHEREIGIEVDSEHKEQIEELLQEVVTEGVAKTVKKVRAMDNIHIVDDFHDALVQYLQARHGV